MMKYIKRLFYCDRNLAALLLLALATLSLAAWAEDDKENSTPATWWVFTGQTAADIGTTLQNLRDQNVRISDVQVNSYSQLPYTVTYVQNTGTYSKQWWWYPQADDASLSQLLKDNNARLIAFRAYDAGNSTIRYMAVMVSNTGADAKAWWCGANLTEGGIQDLLKKNNARLTSLQSYVANGQTLFAVTMIANTGADGRGWWWSTNASPKSIGDALTTNKARLLDLTAVGNGNFNAVMEACSGACTTQWYFGQSGEQILAEAQKSGARVVSADAYPGCGTYCFFALMMPGSTGSQHGSLDVRLGGYFDLHTHPMSNLGFGGKLFYGGVDVGALLPNDPDCNRNARAGSMQQAMGHDASTHGGIEVQLNPIQSVQLNPFQSGFGVKTQPTYVHNPCGDEIRPQVIHQVQQGTAGAADESDDAHGAPDFSEWPVWNDITHQKMWVDWIRRAYDSGLRVMVALAVNNKTLGDMTAGSGDFPTNDRWSADKQIAETRDFIGRHADFMEVAYNSTDLARIVAANKLAVVIGVEIDNIGNLNTVNPLTNQAISAEIDRLYQEGVRYIFPVHVIDNPFGGTAAYLDLFNYSNRRETGHWWNLVCADSQDQITYSFKSQNNVKLSAAIIAKLGNVALALDNPPNYPHCGQRNAAGLTAQGEFAITEMMRHGMLIDLDHMSEVTFNKSLDLAEKYNYPVNSGHSSLREGGGSERNVTVEQYARIGKLHGMAGVGSAGVDACNWTNMTGKVLQAMNSNGGVGFGTDTDGLAMGMPTSSSISTPAAGDPAIMMDSNQQHLLYRDIHNSIVHVLWDSNSNRLWAETWAGPDSPHSSPPAAGDPAVMTGNNQQHLFYRDSENNMIHIVWDGQSSQLRAPEKWGTNAVGNPAVMMDNNQQHLFYRDSSGGIEHVVWDSSSNQLRAPEKWAGPGSPHNAPPAAGDPAVMMGNNQQHLFYRDSSGSIEHVVWDSSSNQLRAPEKWAGPGSPHNAPPAAGAPAVMMGNNQQHLFYRDSSGSIEHVVWDSSSNQLRAPEKWAGPGSPHNAPPAAGDPVVMMGDNQQHLFYRDLKYNIVHVVWDSTENQLRAPEVWAGVGSSTGAPVEAGSSAAVMMGHPIVAVPGLATMGPYQQHLFYLSPSGAIWHVLWDPSSGMRSETWAPARDSASVALDGMSHIQSCMEYHPKIAYSSAFTMSSLGSRTWNYNTDGVAHYGMLADFMQAVGGMQQHGTLPSGSDLIDKYLLNGAEYFLDTWKLAEQQSAKVH